MPGLSWKKTSSASWAERAGCDPAGGGANSPESAPVLCSGPFWTWIVSSTGGVESEDDVVAVGSAPAVTGLDPNAFHANPRARIEMTAATKIVDHRRGCVSTEGASARTSRL